MGTIYYGECTWRTCSATEEELLRIILIGPSIYMAKPKRKIKRKMGHVTIMTDNIEKTLEEIDSTGIWSE